MVIGLKNNQIMIRIARIVLITGLACMSVSCKKNETASLGDSMIQKGSNVKIEYTLTVDGEKVDSSEGRGPLAYVQGAGSIISGLEEELEGLTLGDKKKVTVSPEKGYGDYKEEAIQTVPKTAFKDAEKLTAGSMVQGQQDGQSFQAMVKSVTEEEIILDLNHPLAGKTLNFDVEVVEVTNQTAQ